MNKKGFTLIEMMIVIIVISGLMYLIIPNIITSKKGIENETCEAYKELVEAQVQAYIIDHDVAPLSIDVLVTNNYIKSNTCPNGKLLALEGETVIEVTSPI